MNMFFYFLSGLSFILGGFIIYFREMSKTILYFSLGFVLLGIYLMFYGIIFPNELIRFVFNLPLLFASILFLSGIMYYYSKKSDEK